MPPATLLDTERLTLRCLHNGDAPFVLELLNQPSFIEFIGDRKVRTVEQACDYIADGPQHSYTAHGHGLLLVQLKPSGTPIGMCGLVKREYLPDADLGFAFLPTYWSQGFAMEAAGAVMAHGFATLAMRRIVAIVQPDNGPSIRLLHKLNFSGERTIKSAAEAGELLLLACQR